MVEESGVDKFLKVEEEASSLLDQLTQLKQEVGHYSDARESLQNTSLQLGETLDKLSGLVEGTHAVVAKLKEIGTAEILNQIDLVKNSLDERLSRLDEKLEEVSAYQKKGIFSKLFH